MDGKKINAWIRHARRQDGQEIEELPKIVCSLSLGDKRKGERRGERRNRNNRRDKEGRRERKKEKEQERERDTGDREDSEKRNKTEHRRRRGQNIDPVSPSPAQ